MFLKSMSVGRCGIRRGNALLRALKFWSMFVVAPVPSASFTMLTAGWVVVLTSVGLGLQTSVFALQTPPTAPQSAACVGTVHAPPAFLPAKTPRGPLGEAQMLVT